MTLRRSLAWWDDALGEGIAEVREWGRRELEPLHLFCDASGASARLGAVLFADGKWFWTSTTVKKRICEYFRHRRDNQIMGLELLAITLGLETFAWKLQCRDVVIHCDNSGAEVTRLSDVLSRERMVGAA